jgi:hypothetical protein
MDDLFERKVMKTISIFVKSALVVLMLFPVIVKAECYLVRESKGRLLSCVEGIFERGTKVTVQEDQTDADLRRSNGSSLPSFKEIGVTSPVDPRSKRSSPEFKE